MPALNHLRTLQAVPEPCFDEMDLETHPPRGFRADRAQSQVPEVDDSMRSPGLASGGDRRDGRERAAFSTGKKDISLDAEVTWALKGGQLQAAQPVGACPQE